MLKLEPSFIVLIFFFSVSFCRDDNQNNFQNNNICDSFELSVQYTQNINLNTFNDVFESTGGLKISLVTPFYWGNIQTSIYALPYFGRKHNYLDFIGIHPNLKWGNQFYLSDRIRLFNAVGCGFYIFYFSKPLYLSNEIIETSIMEGELSMGFVSKLDYLINNKINLIIEVNKDHIFTYKNIDFINISIGFSYLFKSPDWMILLLE